VAANIEHEDKDGARWIRVTGELDYVEADETSDQILTAIDTVDQAVVDLSGVSFLGSAGIRVLLRASKRLSDRGGKLRVTGLSATVRRVFATIGISDLIPQVDG
jgi:anti-sigma B factor antagonist